MQGPSRNVIVNESDNRKLGVYTEGDTDAAIDGLAVLGEAASNTLTPVKVNSVGQLDVGNTTIGDGRTTVTTAGTAVALATSTSCRIVDIMAETDNTNYVVVGGSTVDATLATRRGIPLMRGQSIHLLIDDLRKIYIDSLVDGEGVTYIYYN